MTDIGGDPRFRPTRWSLVQRAFGEDAPPADARQALGELISLYWKPVYAFLRRRGDDGERAKDLTQAFFADVLETGLAGADPGRGTFRSYLLGALKHFVADAARAEAALKRGGGRQRVDLDDAEAACSSLIDAAPTPDAAYERRWAEEVVERAMQRLERELTDEGRLTAYRALRLSVAPRPPSYAELARLLGVAVTDVTNHLHRARKRYRAALRAELLPGVADVTELDAELQGLLHALGAGPDPR